jgi:hypothetical protein
MTELCVQIVYSLLAENGATINAEVGIITVIWSCHKSVSTNFNWNNLLHGHCPLLHVKNETAFFQVSIGLDPDAKIEVNTYSLVPNRHS